MSLQEWEDNGWLKPHRTSAEEIRDLLAIVDRYLADARIGSLSADWRFGIAYNAALKLCTVLLHARGYRPVHSSAHYRTLAALPLILGEDRKLDAAYLESCRRKRNTVEYDRIGGATNADVDELIEFAKSLRNMVTRYIETNHTELHPPRNR